MSSRSLLAVAAALVLAAACSATDPAPADPTSAVVSRVADGDSLVLRDGKRVRLLQIDAPELRDECYGDAAARELARLVAPGVTVALEADPALDDVDRFGRLLRYVDRDGTNVNVELVRRGAAAPFFRGGERGRFADDLLAAVASARDAARGMWRACRVSWDPERQVDTRPR